MPLGYSEAVLQRKFGPGPVSADRPRRDGFGLLLQLAGRDADVFQALREAYREHAAAERRRLVQSALQDLADPTAVLQCFLTAETDKRIGRIIVGELGLLGHAPFFGRMREQGDEGEASLIRWVDGAFEAMTLRWHAGQLVGVDLEVLTQWHEPPLAVDAVVGRVTPMLWRHLRNGGQLPARARAFARCFSRGVG